MLSDTGGHAFVGHEARPMITVISWEPVREFWPLCLSNRTIMDQTNGIRTGRWICTSKLDPGVTWMPSSGAPIDILWALTAMRESVENKIVEKAFILGCAWCAYPLLRDVFIPCKPSTHWSTGPQTRGHFASAPESSQRNDIVRSRRCSKMASWGTQKLPVKGAPFLDTSMFLLHPPRSPEFEEFYWIKLSIFGPDDDSMAFCCNEKHSKKKSSACMRTCSAVSGVRIPNHLRRRHCLFGWWSMIISSHW